MTRASSGKLLATLFVITRWPEELPLKTILSIFDCLCNSSLHRKQSLSNYDLFLVLQVTPAHAFVLEPVHPFPVPFMDAALCLSSGELFALL